MKVYILREYLGGSVGAYSTREKAFDALRRDEKEIRVEDNTFRYEDGDYSITEVEIDGELVMIDY